MKCSRCGTHIDAASQACLNCGLPRYRQQTTEPASRPAVQVANYIVPALLVTFCCMPIGIVAILYAAQASSKALAGDLAGAQYAARRARFFCWLAFLIGILLLVIYGALGLFYASR